MVSNHVSWLDIPVLGSLFPLVFVAKHEIAGWPVFGLFAKLQRSVFVDRTRRQKTGAVNAEIAARMAEGEPVVLFGEGTSSDGNRVLPFRSALIGAAHDALESAADGTVAMQPVSIAYTRLDGLPMGRFLRPHVAWYGDMDMPPHLMSLLKRSSVDVVVSFGPAAAFDGSIGRKEATRALESAVRAMTAAALTGRDLPHTAAVPFSRKTAKTRPLRRQVRSAALRSAGRGRQKLQPGGDGSGAFVERTLGYSAVFTVPSHHAATLGTIDSRRR